METTEEQEQEKVVNALYDFAADELLNKKKTPEAVKATLIEKGVDEEGASTIVNNLEGQIKDAKREGAKKDMMYGALWCVGGTVATVAEVGYIFWGAILFGGFQFFKGVINYK